MSVLYDLVKLNAESNSGAWFKVIKKVAAETAGFGSDDPVGDYGRGVLSGIIWRESNTPD